MLGAIIGDIAGSVYEKYNIKTADFPMFGGNSNFTDDTVMIIAVAEALMQGGQASDYITAMRKYGRLYPNEKFLPNIGYGNRFVDWLDSDKTEPYGSYGNGSAMRVSPVGWWFDTLEKVEEGAKVSAAVTHNHPEGIKGAQATAAAIFLARNGESKDAIRDYIEGKYEYNLHRTLDEIRPVYKYNETCQKTVPEAITAFLESTGFEDAIRKAVSLGGDSDTLAAITGGIAEAAYGVPDDMREKALAFLDEPLKDVFYRWKYWWENKDIRIPEMSVTSPDGTKHTTYRDGWDIRIAAKNSWQNSPISKPKEISMNMRFNGEQTARMKRGLIPAVMEDKWFIYYEDGWLNFHRSWTGAGIYKARLVKEDNGYVINSFWAERDKKKYKNDDDGEDRKNFTRLVACGLLDMDISDFYDEENLETPANVLEAWSNFGRMMLKKPGMRVVSPGDDSEDENEQSIQECRLLNYGTGVDFWCDGYVINGRVYVKIAQEERYRYMASSRLGIRNRIFSNQAEFEAFKKNHPKGFRYFTEEIPEQYREQTEYPRGHVEICGEYYAPPQHCADLESEWHNNLVQLEIDCKWGYADAETGDIVIEPKWDWCGPFVDGYAMVRIGCPGKPGAAEPQEPGYYDGDFYDDRYHDHYDNHNYGWEWTMEARCGFINTRGELVVPLEYVDANPESHSGLFIVRKPGKSFGVVDKDSNIIIDFDWFGIELMECGDVWSAFVTYTDCKEEVNSVYSLYSTSGNLIVGGLDETPDRFIQRYSLDVYYDKIDKLDNEAKFGSLDEPPDRAVPLHSLDVYYSKQAALDGEAKWRYIVVRRGGMLGAVADGRLLCEPTLAWRDLWAAIRQDWNMIKKNWESNDLIIDEMNERVRREAEKMEKTADKPGKKIADKPCNLDQDPSADFTDADHYLLDNIKHHWSIMQQRKFFVRILLDEEIEKARETFKSMYGYSPSV